MGHATSGTQKEKCPTEVGTEKSISPLSNLNPSPLPITIGFQKSEERKIRERGGIAKESVGSPDSVVIDPLTLSRNPLQGEGNE